ncbi:hypothetical protein J6590_058489 [Homalodisca vitripennis]|nr:hypothetical protein J6590_058489 [Homalodisca vitripennis]
MYPPLSPATAVYTSAASNSTNYRHVYSLTFWDGLVVSVLDDPEVAGSFLPL